MSKRQTIATVPNGGLICYRRKWGAMERAYFGEDGLLHFTHRGALCAMVMTAKVLRKG